MKISSKIKAVALFFFLPLIMSKADFAVAGQVSDMIGIRVLPNAEHFSAANWYGKQKFAGSPQEIVIDGYRGVRDGNTVYVNASTISGICMNATANNCSSNSDCVAASCSRDYFQTKIFIISMSAGFDDQSRDIFGQILNNWHFNTNLDEPGTCTGGSNGCLADADCESGICSSKKAQVARDTIRLADIADVKEALTAYKAKTGKYPLIKSGSYMPNVALSVWPSWQGTFAKILGVSLPSDPVNKIGACPGYDPVTCYDVATKRFATDYSYNLRLLPGGSRLYAYSVNEVGTAMNFCGALESVYANIMAANCADDNFNNPPILVTTQFTGKPKQEFTAFATGYDSDGDYVTWTIDLINPAAQSTWTNPQNLWQWDDGFSKLRVVNMLAPNLKMFHAKRAGRAKTSNLDRVRITLNDGRGKPNSIVTKEVDISISPASMTVTSPRLVLPIGQNGQMSIAATDSSNEPITSFSFGSASLWQGAGSTTVSQADLQAMGIVLEPANSKLRVEQAAGQKTGEYVVNALFTDAYTAKTITGSFNLAIINHPPVINLAKATFGNNTVQVCDAAGTVCDFAIDNAEAAKLKVTAIDSDAGHIVKYRFKNYVPTSPGLYLDYNTGEVTGFEHLNPHITSTSTVSFTIEAYDQYCANSSLAECSDDYAFNVTVMPYCDINDAATTLKGTQAASTTKLSGQSAYGDIASLKSCSAGKASVDVKYNGEARSKSIVVVSDLSDSMKNRTPLLTDPRAIDALKATIKNTNGLVDRLHQIASHLPAPYTLTLGTVAFNAKVVDYTDMANILTAGVVDNVKNHVGLYAESYGTHTLDGLNKAESLLLQEPVAPKKDRVVILISDGKPVITAYHVVKDNGCKKIERCNQCGNVGSCYNYGTQSCGAGETACSCSCLPTDKPSWCGPDPACTYSPCNGCYCPSVPCVPTKNCYGECNCNNGCGYTTPPCTSKNTEFKFDPFANLLAYFQTIQAFALTTQTQCITNDCPTCPTECTTGNPDTYCENYRDCTVDYDFSCSIETNTTAQAQSLKNAIGAKIYSVYFDTMHNGLGRTEMLNWSSDNGDAAAARYFFEGTNVSGMLDSVLRDILSKPKNLKIGDTTIADPDPYSISNTILDAPISSGAMCTPGFNGFSVQYDGIGDINTVLSNFKYEYCPLKLHP